MNQTVAATPEPSLPCAGPGLHALLAKAWAALEADACGPAERRGGSVVFLTAGDGRRRACTVHGRGTTRLAAWQEAVADLIARSTARSATTIGLRIDVVDEVQPLTWRELSAEWTRTRRNYVAHGLAWDADFDTALLAQELHGNAILYDVRFEHAQPRPVNLRVYAQRRFGRALAFPSAADAVMWRFTTRAHYVDATGVHRLAGDTRARPDWGRQAVRSLIDGGSDHLAAQVRPDGRFVYGQYPCFDRTVPGYNTLRHASSTYALLEAWDVTRSATQAAAIDRALARLTDTLIARVRLPDGTPAAFLVDTGGEIKLGGNAVSLLALVKHAELTGDRRHGSLMRELAQGIAHMQDGASGAFVHVLEHPALAVKERFRTIYYDGEASFALMRLYGWTGEARWLAMVERAFDHFIAERRWQTHDHWLGYSVNELTRHRPDPRYFEFGLRNVADHLDFVLERITTFPTLLELMMAAQDMLERMDREPALAALAATLDRPKFARALAHRARYLAEGCFTPELAMFFARPDRITGAFFIRHHGFRIRIDDVEHYLSGYIAYLRHLEASERAAPTKPRCDRIEEVAA